MANDRLWRILGPVMVAIGAALWGTESLYRIHLNERFSASLLVFYEHLFILVLMLPFLVWQWRKLLGHSAKAYAYLVLSGIFGSALGAYTFTKGLSLMAPTAANLLLNIQPVFCALIAYVLLRERIARSYPLWAVVCLVAGAALAIKDPAGLMAGNTLAGLGYILATAFCWGLSTAIGRGALLEIPSLAASCGRLVIGTVISYGVCLAQGTWPSLAGLQGILATAPEMFSVGFFAANDFKDFFLLAAFAGALPLVIYYKGLAHTPATVGTFCEMVQNLAALLVTWGLLGDALTPHQMIAAVVLLVAVSKLNAAQQAANSQPAPAPVPAT